MKPPRQVEACYPALPLPLLNQGETMKKSELYTALRTELHRHDFSTFVDEPPSVALGGKGVVVPGCPQCKKRFGTTPQFLDHLTDDVLPAVLNGYRQEKLEARASDLRASPTHR